MHEEVIISIMTLIFSNTSKVLKQKYEMKVGRAKISSNNHDANKG